MPNSNLTVVKLIETSAGSRLTGSQIEIKCQQGYKTPNNEATCGQDGKWTPNPYCYPGFFLVQLYT